MYLSFHSKFSQEHVSKHLPNGLSPDFDIGFIKSLHPLHPDKLILQSYLMWIFFLVL